MSGLVAHKLSGDITNCDFTGGQAPRELIGVLINLSKRRRTAAGVGEQSKWRFRRKAKRRIPNSDRPCFKNALKQRVKIEPVIGHLKSDHRMNRCRCKGARGDTINVVWATLTWNTKKVTHLHRQKEEKQAQREMKRAV